jgi:hypothetical protein
METEQLSAPHACHGGNAPCSFEAMSFYHFEEGLELFWRPESDLGRGSCSGPWWLGSFSDVGGKQS